MDAMVGTALHEAGDVNELQELHLELIEQQDRPVSGLGATAKSPQARLPSSAGHPDRPLDQTTLTSRSGPP
jgi:hypothetical protein